MLLDSKLSRLKSPCMDMRALFLLGPLPEPVLHCTSYFERTGSTRTPVYSVETLRPGHTVTGPALFIDKISTIVIEPECAASITSDRNILINVASEHNKKDIGTKAEPIQLAIFMHR